MDRISPPHGDADVAVTRTGTPVSSGNVYGFMTSGAPVVRRSIGLTALRLAASGLPVVLGPAPPGVQLLDGLPTGMRGVHYSLGRNSSLTAALGTPAWLLVRVDTATRAVTATPITLPPDDAHPPDQWTALAAVEPWGALAVVGLAPATGEAGKFSYQVRLVDPATGAAGGVQALSAPQDTFVNVLAVTDAGVDPASGDGVLHLLAGDENSLYTLDAQVFTAPLAKAAPAAPASMPGVSVDNSRWTLPNLYREPASGRLLGVSPGLYGNTTWSLVEVDPASGTVTPVGPITGAAQGVFASWYGGTVAGTHPPGRVVHLFQHALDGSFALATIDADTGALVTAPTLLNGIDGEFGTAALAYVSSSKA